MSTKNKQFICLTLAQEMEYGIKYCMSSSLENEKHEMEECTNNEDMIFQLIEVMIWSYA